MSEASLDLVHKGPFLGTVFQHLTPLSEQYRELIASKDIWIVPPYPHEERMVAAYLSLKEKREGNGLSAEDANHTVDLLEWISSLAESPKLQDHTSGAQKRSLPPPLLSQNSLSVMKNEINTLKHDQGTEKPNNSNTAFFILKRHVSELKQQQITSIDL